MVVFEKKWPLFARLGGRLLLTDGFDSSKS